VIGELLRVDTRERFEANNVKWLKRMSTVRRKHSKECTIGVAVVDKFLCKVTAMAVKYKKTPVSLSLRAFSFVQRSKTCSSHAKPTLLFVQPDENKVIKTLCFSASVLPPSLTAVTRMTLGR
jgi:hypothetical protein